MKSSLSMSIGTLLCVSGLFCEARASEIPSEWIPGTPVAAMTVRQQSMESCWAYAYVGLIENHLRLHGKKIDLSPEYLIFNAQANHLARELYQMHVLYEQRVISSEEGVSRIRLDGQIGFAGKVSEAVGMVAAGLVLTPPLEGFVDPEHDPLAKKFVEWEKSEIENFSYSDEDFGKAGSQIYEKLFSLFNLRKVSSKAWIGEPGHAIQPQKLLKEYLGFHPDRMVENILKVENSSKVEAFAESIAARVATGHVATLDFPIIGKSGHEYFSSLVKPDFVFDGARALDPENYVLGQHVAVVVNSLRDKTGKLQALVIQNSMGLRGRDRWGRVTEKVKDRGYDVLTLQYLKRMSWEGRNIISSWYYPD